MQLNGEFLQTQLLIDCLDRMKAIDTNKDMLAVPCRNVYEDNRYQQIDGACKNKDDCVRELAKHLVNEFLQRQYNINDIQNKLTPLITSPHLTPNNFDLNCCDSNENVRQCSTLTKLGICIMSHRIYENKLNLSCINTEFNTRSIVSIYQSNNHATFDVQYNRSLCNDRSTLNAVQEIMFKYETAILQCDFETNCNDFDVDSNWGLTDGLHPHSINHDHTLNNSSGHYLFYNPNIPPPPYTLNAEIKTKQWLQLSTDRAVCFRMWYYTPRLNFPFTIQLVQGDDEQLTRIIASIHGKDPSINDWTLINITLPAEKIKLFIRLNTSAVPLTFDDISIDYCDGPRPLPPKTLFSCDFESSCVDNIISLPHYPYQWSIMKASDAAKIESEAPSVDFTFGNQSGHYAFVPNSKIIEKGNVGYLALQTSFNITINESFCLNFEYYGYGRQYVGNLKVYAWMLDSSESVQNLWPPAYREYIYTSDTWTWSIMNLPVGYYSLLFRVDSTDTIAHSFALDNISVTSCDYPPSTFTVDSALLSFSCNFDNLTMCDMKNEDRYGKLPNFNFTVVTGDTIPDRELGPMRDHTSNSTSGGFIYWDRHLPFQSGDSGSVHPSKVVEANLGMCVRFAYYVKSAAENENGTAVSLWTGGCDSSSLWTRSLDDSYGWQVVVAPVPNIVCEVTLYFITYQHLTIPVAVAFDDIDIGPCDTLYPTTTTSSTSTTTTTTTTATTITSTTTEVITTSSSSTETTTVLTSLTTSTIYTTTSTQSNSRRLLSLNEYNLIAICFLLKVLREIF
ncbi:unnamed protein product [Rotaria sordida]|uniref:MAM domain-containing protein n=1 Tax=Rotaria sordida TaxID=392033 RepID=A0A814Y1N8_9BILA|nr:unnamed protein product [Rotaria sordida]